LCASEGLLINPDKKENIFGLRAPTVADVLDGKSGFQAAGLANTEGSGYPYGSQSRYLFPAALIEWIEAYVPYDRTTDAMMFDDMVANDISVDRDHFDQPVIDMGVPGGSTNIGGPQYARAQRIAQLAEAPRLLSITTSDRPRRLPTYGMGIEMSDQAKRSMTMDLFGMTIQRYLQVEKDARVYQFLSSLFAGDLDMVTGAVPAITSNSLDSNATGGVMTHKAWVKFLAHNRKRRTITHCIGDIDAYLAVEGRIGRPNAHALDLSLSVIDPQAVAQNTSFGSNVKWFIVNSASDPNQPGPVPAGTVWALDASTSVTRVKNTMADYTAAEQFVLRRSEVMTIQWGIEVYRTFGDNDLTNFDVLTIS
ncbi:MAG: hypothetical protein JO002_12680, partial [Burkholderiaceae bacterium]|nr:hypothetical protein [Burkholderiaceae bacterium]